MTLDEILARHAKPEAVDEVHSILNYGEAPRIGDWTLRSALVRLAQPHPLRSEAVLALVRRLDASLKSVTRSLQQNGVASTRSIPGGTNDVHDIRLVDLALSPDLLDSYHESMTLTEDERASVGLIELALELDRLADVLAAWANAGSADPPLEEIDTTCARVLRTMDDSGVPEEPSWEGQRGRGV